MQHIKLLYKKVVSIHRAPHLLCCRALEVQKIRLYARRLASTAPYECLQFIGWQHINSYTPVNEYKKSDNKDGEENEFRK